MDALNIAETCNALFKRILNWFNEYLLYPNAKTVTVVLFGIVTCTESFTMTDEKIPKLEFSKLTHSRLCILS